jgi:hypothetical protein
MVAENKSLRKAVVRNEQKEERTTIILDEQKELNDAKDDLIKTLKKELNVSRHLIEELQKHETWKFAKGFTPRFRVMCYEILAQNVSAQAAPKVIDVSVC